MRLKTSLTIQFSFLVVLLLSIFSFVVYQSYTDYRKEDFNERLNDRTINIVNALLSFKESESLQKILTDKNNFRLLNTHQILIFHKDTLFQAYPELNRSISQSEYKFYSAKNLPTYFSKGDTSFINLTFRFEKEHYLVIASATDTIGLKNSGFLRQLIFITLLSGAIITIILGMFFSSRALKPISDLIKEISKITEKNLSRRLPVKINKDEINLLCVSYNQMLDRLETSFLMQRNFVSNASHEFRTPITAMRAQIEVMLMQERSNQEYIKILDSLKNDIDNLRQLIDGLGELSKINAQNSLNDGNPVSIIDAVDEARIEVLKSNPGYQIGFVIHDYSEDMATIFVNGNHFLLKSLFKNLIDNACKFSTDKKCNVVISTTLHDTKVNIKDNGPGIDAKDLPHIFEPFYRTNDTRNVPGHGIGLSLVKRIIEIHNGKIDVKSELSKGSEFEITLPLYFT